MQNKIGSSADCSDNEWQEKIQKRLKLTCVIKSKKQRRTKNMLKLKGKLDFTLLVKVEGADPVNGKRPNKNIKKKFLILGIAIIIGMKGSSGINLYQGCFEFNETEYNQNETNV